MKSRRIVAGLAAALLPAVAHAQDFSIDGFADFRLVKAPDETNWLQGGLGKLRYGGGDTDMHVGSLLIEPRIQITEDILALADIQYDPGTHGVIGATQAFVRYRPVSTSEWRWSVKIGAFFPPVSLENDGIGWSTTWTLTPSAINSWIGDEVRPIGSEFKLEWRQPNDKIELVAALFGANDTAGTLLGQRGWSLDDIITPLAGHVRAPDVFGSAPAYSPVFEEIDDNPGYYIGLSWSSDEFGRFTVLRYDNDADTMADFSDSPWHTSFWSLGVTETFGDVTVLAQAMVGDTQVAQVPGFNLRTDFWSGYLLVGWDISDTWRVAARVDEFGTGGYDHADALNLSEHGWSQTFDISWRPRDWVRLGAELLRIDSWRQLRKSEGIKSDSNNTEELLSVRFSF